MSVQQRQQKRRRNRSAGVTRRADIIEPIVKEEPASNKYAHLDTMDKVWQEYELVMAVGMPILLVTFTRMSRVIKGVTYISVTCFTVT